MRNSFSNHTLSSRRSLSSYNVIKQSMLHRTNSEQLKRTFLEKLRSRKSQPDLTITGDMAAKVVKDYLLPMFESSTRRQKSTDRINKANSSTKSIFSRIKGTVYDELKLTETLSSQLDSLKEKLSENDQFTKTFIQEKQSILIDLSTSQRNLASLKSTIKYLINENNLTTKESL